MNLLSKLPVLSILLIFIFFNTFYSTHAVIERPEWIINADELPEGWTIGSDIRIGDRYFLSVFPHENTIFSIESLTFINSTEAKKYVEGEYMGWKDENQLEYVFHNDKVNLSVTDTGVVWEVKSSCCYSRGVLFVIEEIYIYIFGSQQATWDEVRQIYSAETIKLLSYLEREIPSDLFIDLSESKNNSTNGLNSLSAMLVLVTISIVTRKKRQ